MPVLGVGEGVKVAIVEAGVELVDEEAEVREGVEVEPGDSASDADAAPGDVDDSVFPATGVLSVELGLTALSDSGTSGIESIGGKYESLPCCRLSIVA